jgi:hypothetical protein
VPKSQRSARSALNSWWTRYPGDYVEPSEEDWAVVPLELEAFSDSSEFAAWVNDGGMTVPGRDVNCADCARAVEVSWRGAPQVSAARAPERGGEVRAQIELWLRAELEEHSFEAIRERLDESGHGASAYIVVCWNSGGAHAFSAVNRNGDVYWVDGQHGALVARWPPRRSLYPSDGYDESDVMTTLAVLRSGEGSSE